MRILIADDNALVRKALHYVLEGHEGWSVCCEAQDGFEAVEQARKYNPDLVLLDLAMPHLSGLQAAARISMLLPSTLLIILTLYDTPLVRAEANNIGVLQVVPKTDGRSLVATIEGLLQKLRIPDVEAAETLAPKIKPNFVI